ncbi:MAG: aldehyde:ferredoxin oxidoreductase [Candidatus Eisenbacteria bacterium]|uniref:Aldehyde:ferredoxin oxidoreductase n=1 Tax=Eiseniibacteriota bacterium TaxID=2212470 RepID=A0A948RVR0_UNCEI|nr:aldehyde:ferredoxin oxidoreductase [Candidatus Eisenbacteria bacterium]MBU1950377.1 aldehyde:ferredoxin oxidoreductase [Candidatus Eisenbacteria bacterium]MBU2691755.1 aldehyde:ferredoxin oxidoreductase [Candidatus Eisenbacteria bacterium]
MWKQILEIDLSSQKSRVLEEEELFHRTMGGTAAGTHLLERYCDPSIDPFDAGNPIILSIGPFSNILPVATKTVALFKSPHTGELGESHAGGRLAMALYNAGFSAIVIIGAAREPVFLNIYNDQVEFLHAGSLWGYSSSATERVLRGRDIGAGGKRSILRIGPAGERLSTYACATVDTQRHFGRLGLGAVMGSKKLKAMVIGGNRYLTVPDKKKFKKYYDSLYDTVVASGEMKKYHDLGTAGNILALNKIQGLPTRNFSQGWFEGSEQISGEVFGNDHLSRQIACAHCQCGCIHLATLREQFHKEHGFKTFQVSYDFELIYALGTNLSINDPKCILKLLHKTEKEGWDAMSVGVTLAWATDAFLGGLIGTDETDGLVLRFGDAETYLESMEKMSRHATPFYKDLEKGAAACSRIYGGEDAAICFGGNEGAGYITGENAFTDWIVGVRHSHLDGAGYSIDQALLKADMSLEDQTKKLASEAKFRMLLNSLVICLFARNIYKPEIIKEGLDLLWRPCAQDELDAFCSDTLRRKYEFKIKCGWNPNEINLPKRLTEVITTTGKVNPENIRRRAGIYWKEIGLTTRRS